ncbi:hypothetical protein DXG01_001896 [Tephrocybe rancida]|nr:hypothetical protein DXG01_001896 [Tephrocybe rancida]
MVPYLFWQRFIIHDATPGTVNVSLKVEQSNLHGGLILSLTDTLGSLAVATKGHHMTGMSTDIGTSFVRHAGRVGDVLHAKAVLTGMGKSLAYTRVDFTNPARELVAYGSKSEPRRVVEVDVTLQPNADHTKYIGKSSSHPQNIKFSEDGKVVIEGEDVDWF